MGGQTGAPCRSQLGPLFAGPPARYKIESRSQRGVDTTSTGKDGSRRHALTEGAMRIGQ